MQQSLLAGNLAAPPFFLLSYENASLGVTVRLLREFGNVQVLSSPKLVVLNNQTAVLKANPQHRLLRGERRDGERDQRQSRDRQYRTRTRAPHRRASCSRSRRT